MTVVFVSNTASPYYALTTAPSTVGGQACRQGTIHLARHLRHKSASLRSLYPLAILRGRDARWQRSVLDSRSLRPVKSVRDPAARAASSSSSDTEPQPQESLLVVECDGVLVDIHREAHLAGFNRAFHDLGLDCAHWSPLLYTDLVRTGGGTGKGMLTAYFDTVGWPTFLPSDERDEFCAQVEALKNKAVPKLAKSKKIGLRDGAERFLRDVLAEGNIKVAVIGATASSPEDGVTRSALSVLESELLNRILILDEAVLPEGQDEDHVSAQIMTLIRQKKLDAAAAVRETLQQSSGGKMNMDAKLLGLDSKRSTVTAELLSTIAMVSGIPLQRSAFMTCSSSCVETANAAGMKSVVTKGSLLSRGAEYPYAAAIFDGYGNGGGATAARMRLIFEEGRSDSS
mmetsp:Transcript_44050/g.84172  ORF Transcript_44050/g.84172 Transcript_44050/m.84172 type:complete len:400 (-) Transcript_44050:482-1681(-)|eukprot:CAMPEP_0114241156 /NCGR_PEP_ID=MMETSP0058-20121206/9486_1 /TAXON_ID=36894 /ORGANISM="Pyramimonas parkeae, CCMP726" /LENGTH=399 /DNA_ID=CAMNT_0001353671 /DNA_START=144 /DNA_END=1343 /DNA_ORIENTATION=-